MNAVVKLEPANNGAYVKEISGVAHSLNHHLAIFKKWMNDPNVNEISINDNPSELWIWRGDEIYKEHVAELSYDKLETIAGLVSNFTNNPISESNTSISGELPDLSRIEITIYPGCPEGSIYLNLRKHSEHSFSMADYEAQGYFENTKHVVSTKVPEAERTRLYNYLTDDEKLLYDCACKNEWVKFITLTQELDGFNGLISGTMGTGKTTFLKSMIELMSPEEMIITVEDSNEIKIKKHPNNKKLFFKRGKGKDDKKVGASPIEALRTCLRKTPNVVIYGELRGEEAMIYIEEVANIGLNRTYSTIHANSAPSAYARLASLAKKSEEGKVLSYAEIYDIIYPVVHYVIQLKYFRNMRKRRVTEIYFDPIFNLYRTGL